MRDIKFKITKAEEGAAFAVHVVPSIKNEILGKHGDALKIRLSGTKVGGAMNEQLIKYLSECLGIDRQKIEIAAGLTSAEKMVVVLGLTPQEVENRLLN